MLTGTDSAMALFRTMARIRAFEEKVAELYRDGLIPGFVHLSIGQEAVAAGVCSALRQEDQLTTTHRGHGHMIAKGADLGRMLAELLGREGGYCRGKGGSMHIASPELGVLGANGIVGAGLPLAVGAALSARLTGAGHVVAAFFGDGALNQGMSMEAFNLAATWDLPVLFVCENNGFAEFTASARAARVPGGAARLRAFGIEGVTVDGNDAVAVAEAAAGQVEACRDGRGPRFLEALTERVHGHYEGDQQSYREADPAGNAERDPLRVAERWAGRSAERERLRAEAAAEVEAALASAVASPLPAPASALEDVLG